MNNTQTQTMTVDEAGKVLGLSHVSAYKAVERGDIPCLKIGRKWMVPKAALDLMLKTGLKPKEWPPALWESIQSDIVKGSLGKG